VILFKKISEFSSWIFRGVKLRHRAIILVLCALLGGNLCDTHYGFSFPFFKIAFTCVAFIVVGFVKEIEDGGQE
jgi:hypothetical protein